MAYNEGPRWRSSAEEAEITAMNVRATKVMESLLPPHTAIRCQILGEGERLTNGDRDREYGPPDRNLANCAALLSSYLRGKYGQGSLCVQDLSLTAEDVAWLNVLQKIARTFTGHVKRDTYVDAATYSAIAGECAEKGKQ